jgi:hypothetical protein
VGLGRAIVVVLLICGAGCGEVLSSAPMGERPPADLFAWQGVWAAADDPCPMRVEVADAEQGRIRFTPAAAEGPCSSADKGPSEFFAIVREAAGRTYVSVDRYADDDGRNDGPSDRFEWVLAERNGDVLRFWLPNVAAFGARVDAGLLPGVDSDDVVLLPLEARDYETIAQEIDPLFDTDAVTLTRQTARRAEPKP